MTQPKLITKPFADDALPGYVNEIPKENPVGAPEQNASWAVGFPPITMTDIDDGGLPPNGEDMNGVLRAITEHNLFIGGGGVYEFTDDYITEVGGYSKGAVLVSDDKTALWMSIQDNNTQNFNGATKTQWRRIAFTELDSTLAGIQSALNTKADKSVTITAGDGLAGGGTLAGDRVLAVNSSVVRTDRTITAGTGLSGGGNLSANRTLSVNYGATAGTAAQGNDVRITGAAQRSANLSDLSSTTVARQNLGLGTAATRDVGMSVGNVMEVGAFGVGEFVYVPTSSPYLILRESEGFSCYYDPAGPTDAGTHGPSMFFTTGFYTLENNYYGSLFQVARDSNRLFMSGSQGGAQRDWVEFCHTGNILTTTGQSTEYPMTQKAVTDALNTKVSLTDNQSIGGIKTFSQFPVTPSAAPTDDYQAANKKYVDDSAIGVGQTWQDVTGSRVEGTVYTNTTGKPIFVSITAGEAGAYNELYVDGVLAARGWLDTASLAIFQPLQTIVPNGSEYYLEYTGDPGRLDLWAELR